MKDLKKSICDHWRYRADMNAIRENLTRRSKSLRDLGVDDLGMLDHMHSGLENATKEFAKWACVAPGGSVLDVGSGLGGSARHLAYHYNCSVVAVELSEELHKTAIELSLLTGMAQRVTHVQGCFFEVEIGELFDAVWIQHVDMQVPGKSEFYQKISKTLKPGGLVYWHDWMLGEGGPPIYPVPWSHDGTMSYPLSSERQLSSLLEQFGIDLKRLQPVTEVTIDWFEKIEIAQKRNLIRAQQDATADKLKLAFFLAETKGIIQNLKESRLVPFFAEAKLAS